MVLGRLGLAVLLATGLAMAPMTQDFTAEAAAKKKGGLKNRSEYTAEQRQKILEAARKSCRKKFGAPATVYRIDYAANKIWCRPN